MGLAGMVGRGREVAAFGVHSSSAVFASGWNVGLWRGARRPGSPRVSECMIEGSRGGVGSSRGVCSETPERGLCWREKKNLRVVGMGHEGLIEVRKGVPIERRRSSSPAPLWQWGPI